MIRGFSAAASGAVQKLQQGLANELQFEKENYSKPESLAKLPAEWKFEDKPGCVNLKISKELGRHMMFLLSWVGI